MEAACSSSYVGGGGGSGGGGGTTSVTECESTISLPIEKSLWDCQFNKTDNKSDVIFLFKTINDQIVRLHERHLEKKKTLSSKRIFGLCPKSFNQYPIVRTIASETRVNLKPDEYTIIRVTHRLLTFTKNGVRVAFNKEETNDGERYHLEFEIEYPESLTYHEILECESKLMLVADSYEPRISASVMALETLFSCIPNKPQMWHCFIGDRPYVWGYKINGVKAKMMFLDDGTAYIWPDAGNVACLSYVIHGDDAPIVMSILRNLCLLVEIMYDHLVLLEAIGGEFNKKTYTLEPQTNLIFMKILQNYTFTIETFDSTTSSKKPIVLQEFFEPPMDLQFNDKNDQYDGLIIVQDDLIIKWKLPTVDVMCVDGCVYSVGDSTTLTLDHEGVSGSVYELSATNQILRLRTDRLASSNQQEYDVFLKSVAFLTDDSDAMN